MPGTLLAIARPASASAAGPSGDGRRSRTNSVRSPVATAESATPLITGPHAASTSRALTGTPSQKIAPSAKVTVHVRPPSEELQDAASAGCRCPSQSTRTRVSYSWRNSTRSAPVTGIGACEGSTAPGAATVSVSACTIESPDRSQMLSGASGGAACGAGAAGAGAPRGAQAVATSAANRALRCTFMESPGALSYTPPPMLS